MIFINGNYFNQQGGTRGYWQQTTRENIKGTDFSRWRVSNDFAGAVMDRVGDHHAMYVDGAGAEIKGYHPFSSLLAPGFSGAGAADRRESGYEEGMANAAAIIESLHRSGGVIDESIKVITHSMGGAYGKGYVQAILDYAKQNNIAGVTVAFEADFAPFQPKQQKAVKGVPTLQFSHEDDMVAGDDQMPGAKKMNTSSDKQQGHSVFGFMNQIKNLPAGKYKVVNGQIVPE